MTSLNPTMTDRQADRRGGAASTATSSKAEALDRAAEVLDAGRHATAARARRRLSAPALRRPAPARDDRDGAGLRAEAADRRRADDRARRDDPGPDPRTCSTSSSSGSGWRHPDHPRPRRHRRPGRPRRSSCTPGGSSRRADTVELFSTMRHPYTEALLGLDPAGSTRTDPGAVLDPRACRPTSRSPPHGCRFAPRCRVRHRPLPGPRTRRWAATDPAIRSPASTRRHTSARTQPARRRR